MRIEFLLNSHGSHTGVPVHVSGVSVHFGYCHFFAQVYRYTLKVYRYTFAYCHFSAHVYRYTLKVYRYTLPSGAFPALLQSPKLHQSFANVLNDSYLLSGHKSLYNYALDLKDLHKSKNTKAIKSTYPHAKCG